MPFAKYKQEEAIEIGSKQVHPYCLTVNPPPPLPPPPSLMLHFLTSVPCQNADEGLCSGALQ